MRKSSAKGAGLVKTNAVRVLDRLGIAYELRAYAVVERHLSAEEVAEAIQMPAAQVFKTLVVRGDRTGPLFAVLPGSAELDLKILAQVSGNRRVELAALKDVTALTGYVRGGTTVLAAKKPFEAFVDRSAEALPLLSVSAGRPGLQVLLLPSDYMRATAARYASLQMTAAAD